MLSVCRQFTRTYYKKKKLTGVAQSRANNNPYPKVIPPVYEGPIFLHGYLNTPCVESLRKENGYYLRKLHLLTGCGIRCGETDHFLNLAGIYDRYRFISLKGQGSNIIECARLFKQLEDELKIQLDIFGCLIRRDHLSVLDTNLSNANLGITTNLIKKDASKSRAERDLIVMNGVDGAVGAIEAIIKHGLEETMTEMININDFPVKPKYVFKQHVLTKKFVYSRIKCIPRKQSENS